MSSNLVSFDNDIARFSMHSMGVRTVNSISGECVVAYSVL